MANDDPKYLAWKADQRDFKAYNQGIGGLGITHEMRSDKVLTFTYPETEERKDHRYRIFSAMDNDQLRHYLRLQRIPTTDRMIRQQLLRICLQND